MEKKDIDWSSLGFGYMETDASYVSNFKDGAWDDGVITPDHTITMNECACVLHLFHRQIHRNGRTRFQSVRR